MIVQAYGAALLIVVAALVIGQAICLAAGGAGDWWGSPAVGLAALIVVATAAIKLPGRAVTALCVIAVVLVAASGFLWWRRVTPLKVADLAVAALPVLAVSLPFISSGRVELQGVSVLNDTANHLLWAEGLRSARMASLWKPPAGYPLGPQSVVAAIGTLTGIPLTLAFTGLLVAIAPLTAIVAQGVLGGQALWRRVVVALMCSTGYLVASYYAEGAFKETIVAAFLLAFVLHMEQVAVAWGQCSIGQRARRLVPVIVLAVGAVYTYSYLGLAWFGVTLVVWFVAEVVRQPRLMSRWLSVSVSPRGLRWIGAGLLLAAILFAPVASQAISFFKQFGVTPASVGTIPAPLANLIHPLSPFEPLDLWLSPDFRRDPATALHLVLAAFALGLVVLGLIWSVRRRRLLLASAVVACGAIWLLASHSGSPYVAAKALVIAVPVVTALALRPVLDRVKDRWLASAALAVTAIFCVFGLDSSFQDLRNSPVQAPEAGRELHAFAQRVGNSRVLFLGDDQYAPWELRPAAVTALAADTVSLGEATARTQKPWVSGDPLDFDSVTPGDLDRFRWVVTSSAAYASQAPTTFRLIQRSRLYELWRRVGATAPRQVIESSGTPGAILDCGSPSGRRIASEPGRASVTSTPVVISGPSLLPGSTATFSLPLPRGRWEISAQYFSDFGVALDAEGKHWRLPAYLGRLGPYFGVGRVSGEGRASPIALRVSTPQPSFITSEAGNLYLAMPTIAATPVPARHRLVPLRRACGRYVDWYRTSTP